MNPKRRPTPIVPIHAPVDTAKLQLKLFKLNLIPEISETVQAPVQRAHFH